jgi:hypothetical protein
VTRRKHRKLVSGPEMTNAMAMFDLVLRWRIEIGCERDHIDKNIKQRQHRHSRYSDRNSIPAVVIRELFICAYRGY